MAFRFLQRGTLKLEKAGQFVLVILVINVLFTTRKKKKDERH